MHFQVGQRACDRDLPPLLALEALSSHSQPASPPNLQANQGWSPDLVSQGLLAEDVGLGPNEPGESEPVTAFPSTSVGTRQIEGRSFSLPREICDLIFAAITQGFGIATQETGP